PYTTLFRSLPGRIRVSAMTEDDVQEQCGGRRIGGCRGDPRTPHGAVDRGMWAADREDVLAQSHDTMTAARAGHARRHVAERGVENGARLPRQRPAGVHATGEALLGPPS